MNLPIKFFLIRRCHGDILCVGGRGPRRNIKQATLAIGLEPSDTRKNEHILDSLHACDSRKSQFSLVLEKNEIVFGIADRILLLILYRNL